jgi:hypothetical protein
VKIPLAASGPPPVLAAWIDESRAAVARTAPAAKTKKGATTRTRMGPGRAK